MEEIKLDINKARNIKNEFNLLIKCGRNSQGYFLIGDNIKRGPFERLFIDRDKNLLVGYTNDESKFYHFDSNGIKFTNKALVDIDDLVTLNKEDVFKSCTLLGNINNHSIYVDIAAHEFFAVNDLEPLKKLSNYIKFHEYEDLLNYYSSKNISLYDKEIRNKINKMKRTFINFNSLYTITDNLDIYDLPDDILFDVACKRSLAKKIFQFYKKDIFKVIIDENKVDPHLKEGFIETTTTTYENLSKHYMEQIHVYLSKLENKIQQIQQEAINHLRENILIDFKKLSEEINAVSILELSSKSKAEISAKRPLTRSIFLDILKASLIKLDKENSTIKKELTVGINFQTIFPKEHDILWEVASNRLPHLYKEYYIEKSKQFSKA